MKFMNGQIWFGVIGLGIILPLNAISLLVFKRTSAHFFSEAWWEAWSAVYIVCIVFLIIGLARTMFCKCKKDEKTTEQGSTESGSS